MHTYLALLRGVNVGGNAPINMAELKRCFEALGLSSVATYINSGNVIFCSSETDARKLEAAIEKAITTTFSHAVRVVVRSFAEMSQLMQHVPKSWLAATDQKCNVIFLRHSIDGPDILKNFSPKPGIEELHYHPGALFWSAKTSDLTKSAMLKVSRTPLYKDMTVRIYNSVRKMYALMQQSESKD